MELTKRLRISLIILIIIFVVYKLIVETKIYLVYNDNFTGTYVVSNPAETHFENFAIILKNLKKIERKAINKDYLGVNFIKENLIYNRYYSPKITHLLLGNEYNLSSTDCCKGKNPIWVSISFYESGIYTDVNPSPIVSITVETGEQALYFPYGWHKDRSQHWRPRLVIEGKYVDSTIPEWRPNFLSNLDSTKYKHIHWR